MQLFSVKNLRILITLGVAYLFGQVLILLLPAILYRGTIALVLLPLIALFFLLMIIRPHIALMLILLFRAGMDPLIEMTRAGDQQMGLGAGINLVVILLTCFMFLHHKPQFKGSKFVLFWLLFLVINFCAVFYSPQPFRALRLFLNFVTYLSMAILPFMLIQKESDKYFWFKCLLVSSIPPILLGNYQFISSGGSAERILGSFQHPNIFAFYLVLMIVVTVMLLRADKAEISPIWKNILKVYLLNLFIMLVFTKTRNAWIACWIIFFIFGLKSDRRILIMTLVLPFFALFIPSIQGRIFDLFQGNDTSKTTDLNSFAWRRRLWMDSLPVIAKRPIEGHGLTSFVPMSETFSDFAFRGGVGAHNTYIEILFETGMLGLSTFVGIWVSLIRYLSKQVKMMVGSLRDEYVLALAYVISYAVVCFADNMNYYLVSNWYTWFFIGIMVACAVKFPVSNIARNGIKS